MDFKDKVTHIEDKSEQSYDIYNINKADIKHLPYSLRVLFENYVRNNKSNIKEVVNKFNIEGVGVVTAIHVKEKNNLGLR